MPQLLLRQHQTQPSHTASCAPVERRKARDGKKQEKAPALPPRRCGHNLIGKLLFKPSVDDAVMANLIAAGMEVDLDTLKKVRVNCISDVKETNGEIDFSDAYQFQKRVG